MDSKLVVSCNQILCEITEDKMGVNQVLKKTGFEKNKAKGIDAINHLIKANLIFKTKDNKHKQKDNIQLTDFGRELNLFILNVDNLKESFNKLNHSIDDFAKNGYI